jgi:hypothetical protein
LSAPRARTIRSASSGNGGCTAFASSHGARMQASHSSAVGVAVLVVFVSVLNQPLLSKETWEEVVHKMVTAYKAPISSDDEKRIVEYLVKTKSIP